MKDHSTFHFFFSFFLLIYFAGNRIALATSPPFSIELVYTTPITAMQEEAFLSAKNRIESFISDSYESFVNVSGNLCGYDFQHVTSIQNLMITVGIKYIDGPGGILGESGPVSFLFEINENRNRFF